MNVGSPQDTAKTSVQSGRTNGKPPQSSISASGCVTARNIAGQQAGRHTSTVKLPTSRLLGIWRLGETIAAGPYSILSAAQPADSVGSTRWDYAVRSIPAVADRRESLAQLQRFATAASAARHPHLIAVLDSSLDGAEPFLVMPRLDNRSLADVLACGAPQPLPVVLWLVRQTAEAAAALHQNGFVHGDIKPENVLLSPRGHATLIDLGFARRIGEAGDGVFRGSPAFAAPESLDGKSPASPASDCFSIARLLWQLLALTDRSATTKAGIDAVADLIAELVDPDPKSRPSAETVAARLVRLEIETLGCHIRPVTEPTRTKTQPNQKRAA